MAITTKRGGPAEIHQQIVTVQSTAARLESTDIGAWRNAVNSARQGRPNQLYRLYENILIDGVFSRSVEKRIEAITNADIVFSDKNGKYNDVINDLIDTPEFEHFLREIMMAQAYGISVIDIMSYMPFKAFSVPRRNINIAKKLITPDEFSESGLMYADVPWIIEVKGTDPLGFIYKAAQYVIYKRGGYGDWAQFVELFGMPFRLGKYSAHDPTTRDELNKSLQMMGGAAYATVPKEADVEIIPMAGTSNGDLYDKFLDRCDKEILITVLGQTMTTVDGSSKSQSETHKDVEEDINKSDRRFVRRVLNTMLLPVFQIAGLPVNNGWFMFPEQGESLSTKDKVDIAMTLRNGGIAVSDEYLYEVSGVRKPATGETVSQKAPTVNLLPANEQTDDPEARANGLDRFFSFFAQALPGRRAPLKY
jgi:phage gp29-like protein